ncbi:MAG: TolC family protein [Gemmataceae bacterium]|nr:TolC family protein [Gemmataceae bacterium]
MRSSVSRVRVALLAAGIAGWPLGGSSSAAPQHQHPPGATPTPSAPGPPAAGSQTTQAPQPDGTPEGTAPITLAELEQLAFRYNPTLSQAAAVIEAARGRALQAGLPLNPNVGLQGEQIGAARTAGEWTWFYVQQEIVSGGKLRLSRLKYEQEAYAAEVQMGAQRLRVVNTLATAYFDVLAAQRSVENHRRQLELAEVAVKTTEELVNVGQGNRQDLLQAQVEARRARVALRTAESRLRRDREHLAVVVGVPALSCRPLVGSLEPDGPSLGRDEALARLLAESPELELARAEVKRDQVQLQRERREPVPNVIARGGVGYNYETRNATAEVGVAIRLPVWDRNQGTVRQAQADLARATAEVTRVELDLRRRFADAYSRYETARDDADDLRTESLPKARQALDIYQQQFRQRRAAFPQVLVAERTVLQLNEDYTRALAELRRAEVDLRGLLLTGGLNAPGDVIRPGHINSVPKPR